MSKHSHSPLQFLGGGTGIFVDEQQRVRVKSSNLIAISASMATTYGVAQIIGSRQLCFLSCSRHVLGGLSEHTGCG